MVGIVIATHANLCEGLLNAVKLIAGPQEQVETVCLFHETGIEEFRESVYNAIEKVDTGDGVLCFVDFVGGSPCNTMMNYYREHNGLHCVVGANMPMVLEVLLSREGMTVEELEAKTIETGRANINTLKTIIDGFESNDVDDSEEF